MIYHTRIPRQSALVGRTAKGWSLVCPLWRREALVAIAFDRAADGEALPDETLIRLPRRFSRPHAWPGAKGPGTKMSMTGGQVLAHVERALRYGVALPSYVPTTIGLRQEGRVA